MPIYKSECLYNEIEIDSIMTPCPIVEAYRRRNSLKYATILAPDVKQQMEKELKTLNKKIQQIEKGCHLCKDSLLGEKTVVLSQEGQYVHKRCVKISLKKEKFVQKKGHYRSLVKRSHST
mgnify:CR=1 FL=1